MKHENVEWRKIRELFHRHIPKPHLIWGDNSDCQLHTCSSYSYESISRLCQQYCVQVPLLESLNSYIVFYILRWNLVMVMTNYCFIKFIHIYIKTNFWSRLYTWRPILDTPRKSDTLKYSMYVELHRQWSDE